MKLSLYLSDPENPTMPATAAVEHGIMSSHCESNNRQALLKGSYYSSNLHFDCSIDGMACILILHGDARSRKSSRLAPFYSYHLMPREKLFE